MKTLFIARVKTVSTDEKYFWTVFPHFKREAPVPTELADVIEKVGGVGIFELTRMNFWRVGWSPNKQQLSEFALDWTLKTVVFSNKYPQIFDKNLNGRTAVIQAFSFELELLAEWQTFRVESAEILFLDKLKHAKFI